MLASPASHPDGSTSFSRRSSIRSSTSNTKRPTSSGQGNPASPPSTCHSPSILGFHLTASTNIRRPSSRGSSNAASIASGGGEGMRVVGGLLLDRDGEMHDPSYTQNFELLRRQLQREAASRQPQLMHWRTNFRHPHHADDDDGDSSLDEEYVSRHVRENINRRRNQSVPHTTTNGTADSAFTTASSGSEARDYHHRQTPAPRRPGSAGATYAPTFGQQSSTAVTLSSSHLFGQTEANSSMEMLEETAPRSSSKSNAKRKGSSNSVRLLRVSSRSRAGSTASAPKKTMEINPLDDWQGSFTGIVDIQREERSRRSSQDAISSASAISLVSGPSTRPGSPSDRRRGSDGGIGAAFQHGTGSQDSRPSVNGGKSGLRGLSGKKSFSKRKIPDAMSLCNRSASMGDDNREEGYAVGDDEDDGDVTIMQRPRGSSKSRSPTSLFFGSKDSMQQGGGSKRTSPALGTQDLPLLTPLDENGGYRDYWQSMYTGEDELDDSHAHTHDMLRSKSQRSTTSSATSADGAPDVLQAMRRKMQSVSLGVKFKALKAERKFKKTFGTNNNTTSDVSGGFGSSHRVIA